MERLNAYELAIYAASVFAAVGIIVLTVEAQRVVRWLIDQPEREASCLAHWPMHDGGELLVGSAHADRTATPSPSLREQFAAAPLYASDQPTSRPDNRFRRLGGREYVVTDPAELDYVEDLPFADFTGTIDEFKAAEIARMDDALRLQSMAGADGYLDLDNASLCDLVRLHGDDYYEPYALDANGDEVGPGWRDVSLSAQA